MALSLLGSPVGFAGAAPRVAPAAASVHMSALDELKADAKTQNPIIGYWDPLNLVELNFWNQGQDATIGFLRHAEIKHGRVAMAAFVGYTVQEMQIKLPWDKIAAEVPAGLSPPAQWDAIPEIAKLQIILYIGFLEVYSEHSFIIEKQGQKHYMRGGKPGYFPTMDNWPHPVWLNLWDPANVMKNQSAESKAKRLVTEVNNGRLAMIGIMGYVSAATIPGSVPGLSVLPYSGEVMRPFTDFNFGPFIPF